jgi:hypothetical protein
VLAPLLAVTGCAASWDVEALAARQPALAALEGQRLGDLTPYALPVQGQLLWFLCRFELDAPIRVALPPDALDAERALLLRALAAWEQAVPGLHFARVEPDAAEIALVFAPDDPRVAATTEAECRVTHAAQVDVAGERLPARLVHARVALRRAQLDWRGHAAPLSEAQQLGAALHELGHALGYQGHARAGETVMVRDVERVRDIGRRVLEGGAFSDLAVSALYRVDSGTLVERAELPSGRTAPVDRLASFAAQHGDGSLFVRVGDVAGRVAFFGPDPGLHRVFLRHLREALRDPDVLELAADPQELAAPAGPP